MKLCLVVFSFLFLLQVALVQSSPAQDSDLNGNALYNKISKLTPSDVSELEKKVTSNSGDIESRESLLIYYGLHSTEKGLEKNKAKHVLWIIENMPESTIAGLPFISLDPFFDGDSFFEAKQLWKKKVGENPDNIKILANAANFCSLYDREAAKEYLEKLKKLEPERPEWQKRLGELALTDAMMETVTAKNPEQCAEALKKIEASVKMAGGNDNRFYSLGDMARLALDSGDIKKATEYSNELLTMAPTFKDDWNYGNAIHDGHTILGRIALKNGDIEKAKEHLIESGKTDGSPQLNSFGPSMDLAKKLMERGEKDVVIQYLELCKGFWEMSNGTLERWINEIRTSGSTKFSKY